MDTNIQKLKAFVNTIDTGSFTRAAEILSYSQSGISHMIRDLEDEWGMSLLDRDRSGVRITSDGMKILPFVRDICDGYDRLQMQLDEMRGIRRGLIRIGSFSSAASLWLPEIISRFKADYPDVEFEISLGSYADIESGVMDGTLDCAFTVLPLRGEPEILYRYTDELLLALREGHPLEAEKTVEPEKILDYPFLLSRIGKDSEAQRFLDSMWLKPEVVFTSWDDYVIMSMIEKGMGISILSSMILERTPYNISTRPIAASAYREIAFIVRDYKRASIAVKRFADYVEPA